MGHEKAPVRLGGLYALERLAQDNIEQRQTVVDVVCAYLRMPFDFYSQTKTTPADSDDYQELQVRLAAQNLLIRHLVVPMVPSREEGIAFSQPSELPRSYWNDVKFDLTGAELFDADFTLCVFGQVNFTNARFRGKTRFWRTRFEEIADFRSAKFYGVAGFARVVFETEGIFEDAEFFDEAEFKLAIFYQHGAFEGARFRGDAIFNQAGFGMGALFEKAQFDRTAQFCEAQFSAPNWFDTAQFNGGGPDFSGSMVRESDRDQRWPPPWQIEPPAAEGDLARLVRHHV